MKATVSVPAATRQRILADADAIADREGLPFAIVREIIAGRTPSPEPTNAVLEMARASDDPELADLVNKLTTVMERIPALVKNRSDRRQSMIRVTELDAEFKQLRAGL